MNKTLHTKWGTAKIGNQGYYCITSRKEGNNMKLLHRLIWEDFYGCEVPKGYVVHHKNEDKLCNCILNLQLISVSEHMKSHNTGENNPFYGNPNNYSHPDKSKMRISEYRNTTGYFRVTKQKTKMCKQGFIWAYQYYEDGKRKSITSISIDELEKKVKAKGLLWEKI